jgi:hypothetical protein
MACLAAIDADGGVFEYEWSAFFGVTLEAGLLTAEGLFHHSRA